MLENKIYKSIWDIADDLRNKVDSWDFKQYVLGMIFYRFISENIAYTFHKNEEDSNSAIQNLRYDQVDDLIAEEWREGFVKEIGYFLLPSELFCNVYKNLGKDKTDEGEAINLVLDRIFKKISKFEAFDGLFTEIDFSSDKLGKDLQARIQRMEALVRGVQKMELSDNSTLDTFGTAYEYLMHMYATAAGKSGGEFFTPSEVSELLMEIAVFKHKRAIAIIYDPACGSGSLLLKAKKILEKQQNSTDTSLYYYGQEINLTTANLCRMNMILHRVGYASFKILNVDTLTTVPKENKILKDIIGKCDVIVSNPPYSIKWEGKDNPVLDADDRFMPAGSLAPKNKADMAFIMHSLYFLDVDGVASIVCFPGILYRSGSEQQIRQYLVNNNFVDSVILLAENLFYGTSIPACILVLRKSKENKNVLFINASNECVKVVNRNKLSQENIKKILDTYKARKEIDSFSKVVSNEEIANNDYNLSVGNYIFNDINEEQEINIQNLNKELESIVEESNKIRDQIKQIIEQL
ncbi:MAG: type I restriction-modification system subunit M [Bacilli bacterium]|nr:type I restriction-modification system subunit M [Bacilli bacterium]